MFGPTAQLLYPNIYSLRPRFMLFRRKQYYCWVNYENVEHEFCVYGTDEDTNFSEYFITNEGISYQRRELDVRIFLHKWPKQLMPSLPLTTESRTSFVTYL